MEMELATSQLWVGFWSWQERSGTSPTVSISERTQPEKFPVGGAIRAAIAVARRLVE